MKIACLTGCWAMFNEAFNNNIPQQPRQLQQQQQQQQQEQHATPSKAELKIQYNNENGEEKQVILQIRPHQNVERIDDSINIDPICVNLQEIQ
eukprot:Pgem_evm1s16106